MNQKAIVHKKTKVTTICGPQALALMKALDGGGVIDWIDESVPGMAVLAVYVEG